MERSSSTARIASRKVGSTASAPAGGAPPVSIERSIRRSRRERASVCPASQRANGSGSRARRVMRSSSGRSIAILTGAENPRSTDAIGADSMPVRRKVSTGARTSSTTVPGGPAALTGSAFSGTGGRCRHERLPIPADEAHRERDVHGLLRRSVRSRGKLLAGPEGPRALLRVVVVFEMQDRGPGLEYQRRNCPRSTPEASCIDETKSSVVAAEPSCRSR